MPAARCTRRSRAGWSLTDDAPARQRQGGGCLHLPPAEAKATDERRAVAWCEKAKAGHSVEEIPGGPRTGAFQEQG